MAVSVGADGGAIGRGKSMFGRGSGSKSSGSTSSGSPAEPAGGTASTGGGPNNTGSPAGSGSVSDRDSNTPLNSATPTLDNPSVSDIDGLQDATSLPAPVLSAAGRGSQASGDESTEPSISSDPGEYAPGEIAEMDTETVAAETDSLREASRTTVDSFTSEMRTEWTKFDFSLGESSEAEDTGSNDESIFR